MGSILFGVIILAIYFLPSIIGYKKRNANAICALNLFLGWTIIGWVVAFVWAVSYEKPIDNSSLNSSKNKTVESKEVHKFDEFYELGKKNEFKGKIEDAIDNYMDALYHLEHDYTDLQYSDIQEINVIKSEINKRIENLKNASAS
jgi:hypothetical protein